MVILIRMENSRITIFHPLSLFVLNWRRRISILNGRKGESSIKLLGIHCSSDYTFEKQATSVIGRMAGRLPHLRKIRDHVSRDVLIRVSTALCLSILHYGIEIWGQKPSLQRKCQRMVNILLRIITSSQRDRSIVSMLAETKLLFT